MSHCHGDAGTSCSAEQFMDSFEFWRNGQQPDRPFRYAHALLEQTNVGRGNILRLMSTAFQAVDKRPFQMDADGVAPSNDREIRPPSFPLRS